MGILFGRKKRILPDEFDRLKSRLRSRGLSWDNVREVEMAAEASLVERGVYKGLDKREKDQLLETLRRYQGNNHLSDQDLEVIDKTLEEEL